MYFYTSEFHISNMQDLELISRDYICAHLMTLFSSPIRYKELQLLHHPIIFYYGKQSKLID